MDDSSPPGTATVSSYPPLATAPAVSTLLAVGATTGRVHSSRTTRSARGTSTSFRAVTTCMTAIASVGSLYGPFVLRVRTNLCSVTGKTGKKVVRRGAHGVRYPAPSGNFFCSSLVPKARYSIYPIQLCCVGFTKTID